MSLQTTANRLKAVSVIIIGFGLATALGAHPAASGPFKLMIDLIFWPADGAPVITSPQVPLLAAVAGGITAGWGVLMWQLASRFYVREPELVRGMFLTSIGTWFVVDGLGSIAAGVPINAAFNIGFLLLVVVPLWRPADVVHG